MTLLLGGFIVGAVAYAVGRWEGYRSGRVRGAADERLRFEGRFREQEETILALTDGKGIPERIIEKVVEVKVPVVPTKCGIGGCLGRASPRCPAGSCAKCCGVWCDGH